MTMFCIQEKEYNELGKIVKVLDDMIHNISIVIEEAPTIVLMATIVLPKKMKDIQNVAEKLKRDAYNIEYLNIIQRFDIKHLSTLLNLL